MNHTPQNTQTKHHAARLRHHVEQAERDVLAIMNELRGAGTPAARRALAMLTAGFAELAAMLEGRR